MDFSTIDITDMGIDSEPMEAEGTDEKNTFERKLDNFKRNFPIKQLIQIDKCILFINEKYTRMNFKEFDYSYEEKITVVGQVTKKGFGRNITASKNGIKKRLNCGNCIVNEIMGDFGITTDDCYMIKPIAIYFEN